jgi:hypothetical protein
MADGPPRPTGREALLVWLKLVALLAIVFAFGLIVMLMRKAIPR